MPGPLTSPYAPDSSRVNQAFKIADLIRQQGYTAAETKGRGGLATVADLVVGGGDMILGSLDRRDAQRKVEAEKLRVQAENEKLADLISSGQPVDLGALVRQVGPARAKEIYTLLQAAQPKPEEIVEHDPEKEQRGRGGRLITPAVPKVEPIKTLPLIDRDAQGIYDPNVMGYIPGTSYTDPAKAPSQSSQSRAFILDGKSKVEGDYVPGVGGKPGTYWFNGQDVTGRATPIPPGTPGGGDRGPTDYQQFGMAERLAAAWARSNQPVKDMDRQMRVMRVGWDQFTKGQDKVGGAQGVINVFSKILDKDSVVREAEYARTAEGQSWLNRLKGFYDTAVSGGANVDPSVLKGLVETGEAFFNSMQTWNAGTRRRINAQAAKYQIDPATIFDDVLTGDPLQTGGGGGAPREGTVEPIPGYPGTERTWRNGGWVRTK